jgi:hypothetical protein
MRYAVSVTPSDTAQLGTPAIIYVGGAGNVAVVTDGGNAITFVGLSGGSTIPVLVKQVKSTGTTATNLLACY